MNVSYRAGTHEDFNAVYEVFEAAWSDLAQRTGRDQFRGTDGTGEQDAMRVGLRSLHEHLAATADQFWVAESDGRVIGYARSILRDGTRELTEFFVRPGLQGQGVGRELLGRAFPATGARHRSIIATTDLPALGRYLRTGLAPRVPIAYFTRAPNVDRLPSNMESRLIDPSVADLTILAGLDREIIGHSRDPEHLFLGRDRIGLLYLRGGRPVGYGYVGARNGPFALRDLADVPPVLADAEARAAEAGQAEFGIEVPLINTTAVEHLLGRGFRIGPFLSLFFADALLGQLDRYVVTGLPYFL